MNIINKAKGILYLIGLYNHTKRVLNKYRVAILLGAPFHSNMGDQAQTYCTEQWIIKNYPDVEILCFDTQTVSSRNYLLLKSIKNNLKDNDLIFLHSGYHTTNLYMFEENLQRKVIQMFPEHSIVILPQTINYTNSVEEQNSRNIYNAHKSLTIMCRDRVSFNNAKIIFPNVKLLLYPDIVTTMIGIHHYNYQRKGILLCLRNDKEAFYSKEELAQLKLNLEQLDSVYVADTTIDLPVTEIKQNLESILEHMWSDYAKYRIIITDRYHGTIFSLIANTPVIVISSTDHKLSSGVQWFPESFKDYVKYVPDFNRIVDVAKEIFTKDFTYRLPAYFNTEYYDRLKEVLEE